MCKGITSRGSPTLVTFATIALLKPSLWYFCLCGTSWGPNLLDEEAAVKFAMGMSSLTSGFTIWSSNGCACLLSSIAVISEMSLSGSSTSALASLSGRSRTIDTSISPPSFLMSSCRPSWAWCRMEKAWFSQIHLSHSSAALSVSVLFDNGPKRGTSIVVFRLICGRLQCHVSGARRPRLGHLC